VIVAAGYAVTRHTTRRKNQVKDEVRVRKLCVFKG